MKIQPNGCGKNYIEKQKNYKNLKKKTRFHPNKKIIKNKKYKKMEV